MSSVANLIATGPAYVPLRLTGRPVALKAVVVLLGSALLAASSQIQVPMYPVPMTMQTFAVLMVGALCGWRLGTLTVLTWFAEALVGIPVLAAFTSGPAVFASPTGGYLAAFPIMTLLVGWLAERGWTARVIPSFIALLAAELICFALGVAWLGSFPFIHDALAAGLTPFALGDLVKTVLAVAVIEASRRALPASRTGGQ